MTTELVTGKAGTPHVGSDDIGLLQASISGYGVLRLQAADGTYPSLTLTDANHVQIPVMHLLIDGRFVRVSSAETVTIDSGTSGMKRTDLICIRYNRTASTGVETASWVVVKGTPASSNPTTTTVSGSIIENATVATYPIASISLDGITPSQPVMLGKELPPVGDSLTRLRFPFKNTKNGDVIGKVTNPSSVTLIEGTVTLSSGTKGAIPFVHPLYPNRAASVSLTSNGELSIWWGSEITVASGVVEVRIG